MQNNNTVLALDSPVAGMNTVDQATYDWSVFNQAERAVPAPDTMTGTFGAYQSPWPFRDLIDSKGATFAAIIVH